MHGFFFLASSSGAWLDGGFHAVVEQMNRRWDFQEKSKAVLG